MIMSFKPPPKRRGRKPKLTPVRPLDVESSSAGVLQKVSVTPIHTYEPPVPTLKEAKCRCIRTRRWQMLGILRQRKEFCDVVLISSDQVMFYTHSLVLGACSSFLCNSLNQMKMKPSVSDPVSVYLGDLDSETLGCILDFIYGSPPHVREKKQKVLRGAMALQLNKAFWPPYSDDILENKAKSVTDTINDLIVGPGQLKQITTEYRTVNVQPPQTTDVPVIKSITAPIQGSEKLLRLLIDNNTPSVNTTTTNLNDMNSVTLDPVTGMVNQQDMVVKTEFTADTKMLEDDDGMPEDDDGANIDDHLNEHVLETSMTIEESDVTESSLVKPEGTIPVIMEDLSMLQHTTHGIDEQEQPAASEVDLQSLMLGGNMTDTEASISGSTMTDAVITEASIPEGDIADPQTTVADHATREVTTATLSLQDIEQQQDNTVQPDSVTEVMETEENTNTTGTINLPGGQQITLTAGSMDAISLGQTIQIQGAINLSEHGIRGEDSEYVLLPVETEDGETQNALVTASHAQSILQQQLALQQQQAPDAAQQTVNQEISVIQPEIQPVQPEISAVQPAVKQEPIDRNVMAAGATAPGAASGNMTTVITAFVCPVCGMTFQRRAALMSHGKIHPDFENHKCTICSKTFTRLDFVKRHVRSHLGYPHECQECHRSYKEIEELNAHHVKIHMKQKKIHECTVCGKVLKNAFNLKEHSRVHTGDKPFLCDACPMRFARSVDLRNHQFVHNDDLRYFCHICGKRFRRPEGRRIHLRNHLGYKPYQCDICDKGFAGRSSYTTHYRNHHRAPVPPTVMQLPAKMLNPITTSTTSIQSSLPAGQQNENIIHIPPGQSIQSVLQQVV